MTVRSQMATGHLYRSGAGPRSNYFHRPAQGITCINAIFYADGVVEQAHTKVLLDFRAALSVVCYEFLTDNQRLQLPKSAGAVGANGLQLDIEGQTTSRGGSRIRGRGGNGSKKAKTKEIIIFITRLFNALSSFCGK